MLIDAVLLPTPNPDAVAAFYRDVLGLPVVGRGVSVGHTRLELTQAPESPGSQHLAFTIPADRLAAAHRWLRARTPLITKGGQAEFHFDPPIDADSIYFLDPDGTILELIARTAVEAAGGTGEFEPAEILGVSEVGVPVDSVPEAVDVLGARFGLTPLVQLGELFAAVGDHDGMLILVPPQRAWQPIGDRLPNRTPVRVEASLAGGGEVEFGFGSRLLGGGSSAR